MDLHRQDLRSCGLAPEVLLSFDHRVNFLENGWLHWHEKESSHWRVQQPSGTQKAALLRLLKGCVLLSVSAGQFCTGEQAPRQGFAKEVEDGINHLARVARGGGH